MLLEVKNPQMLKLEKDIEKKTIFMIAIDKFVFFF